MRTREVEVFTALRSRWLRHRRFRATLHQLKATPPHELRLLGIHPDEMSRLAAAAAQI